ncbi:MAG: tRNA pseudouridine(54/55) synthase Pus10 [Candidatus Thermoplasmatota archaeon]
MKKIFDDKEVLKAAEKILNKKNLCDHCLGRFFALIHTDMTNKKRGQIIRKNLKVNKKIPPKKCDLCEGLFNEIEKFADIVISYLNEYEFESFLIGTKIDEDILENEKLLFSLSKTFQPESIKRNLNREIGKIVENKIKKEVDFKDPDITCIVDTLFDIVELQIKPLFIYGRYNKYKRGIPQTKWFCRTCRGKGCKKCDFTGKKYETSIEELISKKFLKKTQGKDESFHGAGREDIDALMLGNGRPFVLEINESKKRNLDLKKVEKEINEENENILKIRNLRYSDRNEIKRLKSARFRKKYKLTVKFENPINSEKLKKAAFSLQGETIKQFTPTRVAHRRAKKIRKRKIYHCEIDAIEESTASIKIEAESGTYIKELISGDNDKTKPNLSDELGNPCYFKKLDVVEVKGE